MLASRSHVGVVAVPLHVDPSVHPAGHPVVPVLYAQAGIIAVPVHVAGAQLSSGSHVLRDIVGASFSTHI